MPCLSFEEPLAPFAHGLIQSGLPTELKKGPYLDHTTSKCIF